MKTRYMYIFSVISRSSLLRMGKCFRQRFRENQNTFCAQYLFFPRNSCRLEIMRKNMVEPDGADDNVAHAHCLLYN